MPIYDYRCDECGHRFSAVQSFSEGPIEKCPNCGKRPRRLITAPAIVFKGGGWYKTDSRTAPKESDGGTADASGDKADKADKGDKKDGAKSEKSESKPEPKADAKPAAGGTSKSEAKS